MRAVVKLGLTAVVAVSAAGCVTHRSGASPAPDRLDPRLQPDSTFLRLCAEPPKPAPGGGVGCLMRIQIF